METLKRITQVGLTVWNILGRVHCYTLAVSNNIEVLNYQPFLNLTNYTFIFLKVAQTEAQDVKKENAELRTSLNEAVSSWKDDKQMTGKFIRTKSCPNS